MPTKVRVLESNSGVAKKSGNAYTIALVSLNGGRTGKIFSNVNLDEYVGKDITVDLALTPDREMFLKATILKVSGTK